MFFFRKLHNKFFFSGLIYLKILNKIETNVNEITHCTELGQKTVKIFTHFIYIINFNKRYEYLIKNSNI